MGDSFGLSDPSALYGVSDAISSPLQIAVGSSIGAGVSDSDILGALQGPDAGLNAPLSLGAIDVDTTTDPLGNIISTAPASLGTSQINSNPTVPALNVLGQSLGIAGTSALVAASVAQVAGASPSTVSALKAASTAALGAQAVVNGTAVPSTTNWGTVLLIGAVVLLVAALLLKKVF